MKHLIIAILFLLPITVSAQLLRSYGVVEIGSTFPTSTSTGAKFAYRTVDSSFYRWISGNTWVKVVEPSIVPDTLYLKQLSGTTAIVDGDTIDISTYLLKTDTTSFLNPYIRLAGYGLLKTLHTLTVDTALISTKIYTNRFLLKSDTPSMLLNYPSTAGYGIVDGGKIWRADTASPNGLATRLFAKTLPTSIVAGQIAYSNGTNLVGNPNFTFSTTRPSILMGATASTSTATPALIDMGGTYSSSAGANPKLNLFSASGNVYGFGVSANSLDYIVTNPGVHNFFISGSNVARIANSGNLLLSTTTDVTGYNLNIAGTGAIKLSTGTDAQRPTNTFGLLRGNTTGNGLEFGNGINWSYLLRSSLTGGVGTPTRSLFNDASGFATDDAGYYYNSTTDQLNAGVFAGDPTYSNLFQYTKNAHIHSIGPTYLLPDIGYGMSFRRNGVEYMRIMENNNLTLTSQITNIVLGANHNITKTSDAEMTLGLAGGGSAFNGVFDFYTNQTNAASNLLRFGSTSSNNAEIRTSMTYAPNNSSIEFRTMNSGVIGERARISTEGFFGLGQIAPASLLHMSGNRSAASWTTNGIGLRIDPATYTNTTSSGTVTNLYGHLIGSPTLAASSATTYTDPITLQINSPVAGTNVTMTNNWGLRTPRIWATEKIYISGSSFVLNNNNLAGSLYPTSSFVIYSGQQGSSHAASVIQEHMGAAGLNSVGLLANLVTNAPVTSGTGSAILGELNVNPGTTSGTFAAIKGFNRSNGSTASMFGFLAQVDYYSTIGGGAQSNEMYGFHGYSNSRNNAGGALFKGYSWGGFSSGPTGSNTSITTYNPLAINAGNLTGVTNTWSYIDHNTTIGSGTVARNVLDLGYSTDALRLPSGTTAQRPTLANGLIRYNSDLDAYNVGRNAGATWDVLGMLGKTQTWTGTNTFQANGSSTVYWTTANTSYPSSALKFGSVSNSPYTGLFEGITSTGNIGGFLFNRSVPGEVVVHGGSLGMVKLQGAVGSTGYVHATFDGQVVGGNNANAAIRFSPSYTVNNAGIAGNGYAMSLIPTYNYVLTGGHTISGFHYNPTMTSMNNITNHYFINSEAGDVILKNTAGTKLMMYSNVNNSGSPEIQLGNSVSAATAAIVRGTPEGSFSRTHLDVLTNNTLRMRVQSGGGISGINMYVPFISRNGTITGTTNNSGDRILSFNSGADNVNGNAAIVAVPEGSFSRVRGIGFAISNTGASSWANATSSDFALYVNNDKKVGIQTTTPSEGLDVNEDLRVRDSTRLGTTPAHTAITGLLTRDANGWVGAASLAGGLSYSGGVLTGQNLYNSNGTITGYRQINLGVNSSMSLNGATNSDYVNWNLYRSDSRAIVNFDSQIGGSGSGAFSSTIIESELRGGSTKTSDVSTEAIRNGATTGTQVYARINAEMQNGGEYGRSLVSLDSIGNVVIAGHLMKSDSNTTTSVGKQHFAGLIENGYTSGLERIYADNASFVVQTNSYNNSSRFNWIRVEGLDNDTTSNRISVYNRKYYLPNERPETWRNYAIGYQNNIPTLVQFARDTFIEDLTLFSVGTLMNSCQELTIVSSMTATAPSHMEIRLPDAANEYRGKKIIIYSKKKDAGAFVPQIKMVGGVSRLYYTTNPGIGGTDPSDQSTLSIDDVTWSDHGTTFEFTCLKIDATNYRWVLKQR